MKLPQWFLAKRRWRIRSTKQPYRRDFYSCSVQTSRMGRDLGVILKKKQRSEATCWLRRFNGVNHISHQAGVYKFPTKPWMTNNARNANISRFNSERINATSIILAKFGTERFITFLLFINMESRLSSNPLTNNQLPSMSGNNGGTKSS